MVEPVPRKEISGRSATEPKTGPKIANKARFGRLKRTHLFSDQWIALVRPLPLFCTVIIFGGRVWTGNPQRPWAEAVAVDGERIVAVGTDAEVRPLGSGATRFVDARGRMLVPGFIDSHTHLSLPPSPVTPISLRFVKTKERFIERVGYYASRAPKGAWILGGEWDHRQWGGELPSRDWIDRATPDNPVWLYHAGQEVALANSAALRAAGIDRETGENPRGGIARDAAGEPTGIIRLNAMLLIDAAAESAAKDEHDRALDLHMRRMAEQGTTSVHNTSSWTQMLVFQRVRRGGRLTIRIYAALAPLGAWKRLAEFIAVRGRGDAWLSWTAVKGYARNWPETTEPARTEGSGPGIEEFTSAVAGASGAGLRVLVHDGGGIHQLLGLFERVRRAQNLADPRFRIEHAFFVTPGDAARFAAGGVIGSLQPDLAFSFDDPREFQDHLPYRLLLDSGARITFGSDQSVGSPLAGIALAVTHPIAQGRTLTVEEALRAYTSDAAYAAFEEKEKGTLEPGKLADMVLIDRDLIRISPRDIRDARVELTIVGGKVVYERR